MFEIKQEVQMKQEQFNLLGLLLLVKACSSQIKPIENITSVVDDPQDVEKWVLQNRYSLKSSIQKLSLDTLEVLSNVVLPKVGV